MAGKQPKQQVLSRFFCPVPRDPSPPGPPRVTTTAAFSPSKRSRALSVSPSPKKPKRTSLPSPTPSLHSKFLAKFLDPVPPSSAPSAKETANPASYTPLEKQVVQLKSAHPDILLMIEVGYRFRFFGEDAAVAAKTLGIFAHMDRNFLTASVPTFRLGFHIRRLVSAGYKVGVVRQTETAVMKSHGENKVGPFARGLSAIYTRATIEAAEGMGAECEEQVGGEGSNYLVCVAENEVAVEGFEVKVGVVAVEISTGDVLYGEFLDSATRSALEAFILSSSPVEILVGTPLSTATEKMLVAYAGSNVRLERGATECFDGGGALADVLSWIENFDDDKQLIDNDEEKNHPHRLKDIMNLPELVIRALAVIVRYLKEFRMERVITLGSSFRPFSATTEMVLSSNTLQQLEVLKNNSDGSAEGSLFRTLNTTCTAFGSRLFKHWLTHPLRDRHLINARLDAVSEIVSSMGLCQDSQRILTENDVQTCTALQSSNLDNQSCSARQNSNLSTVLSSTLSMLGRSSDIQRGITRIFHRTATAKEFVAVIQAILIAGKQLQKLSDKDHAASSSQQMTVCSPLLSRLISTASDATLVGIATDLLSHLDKDAADQGNLLKLFISTTEQFPEVSEGHIAVEIAEQKLNLLLEQYRKQVRVYNLEYKTISGTSHLIELPAETRVPSNWVKVSSTKKSIRYHPPEVLKALEDLLLAKEQLSVICRNTWCNFLTGFGKFYAPFQAAVHALASLDCLFSLATLSKNKNYVRPEFVDDHVATQIYIKDGRHPVLESILGESFVPNSTDMHAHHEYCQIVTGPNMGGKSCYIRQVALLVMMAQVGSFVPASCARLHVVDGIYTRMGSSDSIQHGTSTFFEELNETSHILQNCSSRSLAIFDELGRGTSTHDGVAIAYATLQYLLQEKKCLTIFVTHYPKILDILNDFKGSVGAYHVSYLSTRRPLEISNSDENSDTRNLEEEEIVFLYKIVSGASDRSFGLNVARLAQLPSTCISRAATVAARIEAESGKGSQIMLTGTALQQDAADHTAAGRLYSSKELENLADVSCCVLSSIASTVGDSSLQYIGPLIEARKFAASVLEAS